MRDASNAAGLQNFRGCRFVVRYSMRNRAVQSNVISKCKMSLCSALHNNKPALGPDFDPDMVSGAILLYDVDEYSLTVKHF